jgi:hypothetical protein
MKPQLSLYNIVIVGAMNPRIHHPSWYQSVGLFSELEFEEAIASPDTIVTPPFSQVQTSLLTISCQEDRWTIQTSKVAEVGRMQAIAATVFDDLLKHTPVERFGFNINLQSHTAHSDVGSYLASCLIQTPLSIDPDFAVSAEFTMRRSYPDHTQMVVVRPGTEKFTVAVASNYEYVVKETTFFKIADYFAKHFQADLEASVDQTGRVTEAINKAVRG